jgi:hypothetical protein
MKKVVGQIGAGETIDARRETVENFKLKIAY